MIPRCLLLCGDWSSYITFNLMQKMFAEVDLDIDLSIMKTQT